MKIIRVREHKDITEHRLVCEHTDKNGNVIERGWGFSFDCDENGKVDESKLEPAGLENYRGILDKTISTNGFHMETTERVIHVPPVGLCDCGKEVFLCSGWANTCDCGCEYNGSGQLLAPRSQWGEETGEQGTF